MIEVPSGYIVATCLNDHKRVLIQTSLVEAVYEYGAKKQEYGGTKPAHTQICYSDNKAVEVCESFDEILDKMLLSDL